MNLAALHSQLIWYTMAPQIFFQSPSMLVDGHTYNKAELERKSFAVRVAKEGIELWKKQKEQKKLKKVQEEKELKQLLENYWPFDKSMEKPRGLRNLRLEGLFPDRDFRNAKRYVGTFGIHGGGGAPLYSDTGKKITKTREDPLLRFQFGKDLRRYVDNTLRYNTNKQEQEEYKGQLDKQVEEKKQSKEKLKQEEDEKIRKQFATTPPWGRRGPGGRPWRHPHTIGLNFLKSLGWSNEETLNKMEADNEHYQHEYDKFKKMKLVKFPNQMVKEEPMRYPGKNIFTTVRNRKLSPLRDSKDHGAELVTLMAKQRRNNVRIPLASTDVTLWGKYYDSSIWRRAGSAYLKDLKQQINEKQRQLEQVRNSEQDTSLKHFSTYESFWGRPGHGAPLPDLKRQRLDSWKIFPQMVPISVH